MSLKVFSVAFLRALPSMHLIFFSLTKGLLQVTPLACTNLKETQSIGKQDPYVRIFFGLDAGRVWSTCPQVPFRDKRFEDGPLLAVQEWKGPVHEDGGQNPNWKEDDPKNTADFLYLPGVEYLRVEIWNKNMMSDNYIARCWVSLADAFRCTRKPGQFCYDLFRDSGKNYGQVKLQFHWTAPREVPLSVCVPLTLQVKGHADASGKFVNLGFMLYDQTISEALQKSPDRGKDHDKAAAYLTAVMPSVMQRFGAPALSFFKESGGVAVSQVDQEALQSGLWPHDVVIGFSQDSGVKEEGKRGPDALVDGTSKWKKINDTSRAKALADLAPFISKGSVTLTVLRAMPFQLLPGNHSLKLAFVIPPVSVQFEPSDLTVIAGCKLPAVQAAVKPPEGKPYWFKLAEGSTMPEGLELDAQTGRVGGVPSTPGTYTIPLIAWNACGSVTVDLNVNVMATPTAFIYADGHQHSYALNKPLTPNKVATIDGTGPFEYIADGLPAGIFIDSSTGTIEGTPTAVVSGQVLTVTAKGPAGDISATIIINVQAPPTNFTYASKSSALRRSEKVTIDASIDGSHPLHFSSDPELPLGLSIDESSGKICGTPANSDEDFIQYTIIASNVAGSLSTSIALRIMDPPTELCYAQGVRGAKLVYQVGSEIIENPVSSVTGSRPILYSVEPTLPLGLNLNPESGSISGTPAALMEATNCMLKAKNEVGEAVTPLLIEVVKAEASQAMTEATEVSETCEQEAVSEVQSFLDFCGCGQYAKAFVEDGWEDLDSIYTMNHKDLADVGVASDDIPKLLAKFPGAGKQTSDAHELLALLRRAECQEYREVLEHHHISTVPELCVLSEEQLIGFGLKKGHARKLFSEIMKEKTGTQSAAVGGDASCSPGTMFSSIKKSDCPQGDPCGVGLQLGRFGNQWGIAGVAPGGPADQDGMIKIGDLFVAIDPGHGPEIQISPATMLQEIAEAFKGARGSPLTLVLKRRGNIFGVNLVRMPIFKHDRAPEAKVTLRVVSALDLPPMDTNGLCDPYVTLFCNHQSKSTSTCWKTRQGHWNSDHTFLCDRGSRLIVSVWDKDRFTSDDLIGKYSCRMGDIVDFDSGRVLQENLAFNLIGVNGDPVRCELGTSSVHLKCVQVAFRQMTRR